MLLRDLTSIGGVSGDEGAIRRYIYNNIKNRFDSIKVDGMGNLIAFKKGITGEKKILLAAHMDEVGFVISKICDDGFLKFKIVGGADPRLLVSQRIKLVKDGACGVIGYKAMQLQDASERERTAGIDNLYIDIGASSREEAEKRVSVGDYAVFDSEYREFGDECIKAKALDDRAGCAVLMSLPDVRYDFDLYVVFTAQEETGARGAKVISETVTPDMAMIVETAICSDVYGTDEKDYVTIVGEGPALPLIDGATYFDRPLTEQIHKIATDAGVPVQYEKTARGGTDAGAIQLLDGGIRTVGISMPARYIHSPVTVISKQDYNNCCKLVALVLQNLQL